MLYAMLIGTYVGVDGEISMEEYAYCRAVFGLEMPPEAFVNMIESTKRATHNAKTKKELFSSPKAGFLNSSSFFCLLQTGADHARESVRAVR